MTRVAKIDTAVLERVSGGAESAMRCGALSKSGFSASRPYEQTLLNCRSSNTEQCIFNDPKGMNRTSSRAGLSCAQRRPFEAPGGLLFPIFPGIVIARLDGGILAQPAPIRGPVALAPTSLRLQWLPEGR